MKLLITIMENFTIDFIEINIIGSSDYSPPPFSPYHCRYFLPADIFVVFVEEKRLKKLNKNIWKTIETCDHDHCEYDDRFQSNTIEMKIIGSIDNRRKIIENCLIDHEIENLIGVKSTGNIFDNAFIRVITTLDQLFNFKITILSDKNTWKACETIRIQKLSKIMENFVGFF